MRKPRVSFGVPIRNEESCVARCLDSILAQDHADFELIVCDNASTDRTPDILESYSACDPRIRLFRNPRDIGQIENCNRVFRLSRGEYFKWVGADDWLEPAFASSCAAALDGDPGAVAATTGFMNHDDRGNTRHLEYEGERLESERPERRFARMLWFFHAGDAVYDPVYGMIRREALERSGLIRMMACADWMLAAELSLMGRFRHVARLLAHRWKPYREMEDRAALLRGYHPTRFRELPSPPWRFLRVLLGIIRRAPLTPAERRRCLRPLLLFVLKECRKQYEPAARKFLKERLGISRRSAWFLRPSAR